MGGSRFKGINLAFRMSDLVRLGMAWGIGDFVDPVQNSGNASDLLHVLCGVSEIDFWRNYGVWRLQWVVFLS